MGKSLSIAFLFFSLCTGALAQAVTLVGTTYPTFVDPDGKASRYTSIVEEAFSRMEQPVAIETLRQAFLGSMLRSEKADGEVAFINLDAQDNSRIYSAPYATLNLVLASRNATVLNVDDFSYIADERVATENRFANTAQLRPVENIRWSRNPTTFDVFKQIGDERAEFLFADLLMVAEFNRLLSAAGRPILFISPAPLVETSVHISLRKSLPNAQSIMREFNQHIEDMRADGTLQRLLMTEPSNRTETLLDAGRYRQLMRNW